MAEESIALVSRGLLAAVAAIWFAIGARATFARAEFLIFSNMISDK
jgi:hypothetical protein